MEQRHTGRDDQHDGDELRALLTGKGAVEPVPDRVALHGGLYEYHGAHGPEGRSAEPAQAVGGEGQRHHQADPSGQHRSARQGEEHRLRQQGYNGVGRRPRWESPCGARQG